MSGARKEKSLAAVRSDWREIDSEKYAVAPSIRVVSDEPFSEDVEHPVTSLPGGGKDTRSGMLASARDLWSAWRLLEMCGPDGVLIVSGSRPRWMAVGALNRILYRGGRAVLCWDVFVEVGDGWKRAIVSQCMRGITLAVLWSRAQVASHAAFLGLPQSRFVFLPYKANHSKMAHYDLDEGNFVFAGGNGKRDYVTLVEAVRGTGIPVIISATDPEVRKAIPAAPNVIVLAAGEPAFAQLQAASRFVVVPMVHTGLKGGGEANFCNGMWHGKPVVAADSIAASDYIIDGKTGYVVPSGDVAALRARILELWHDRDRAARMGQEARRHVEENLTHADFLRRLVRLAGLLVRDR